MNPGHRHKPLASITRAASPVTRPTPAMAAPETATSPLNHGFPLPSTTLALRMSKSYIARLLHPCNSSSPGGRGHSVALGTATLRSYYQTMLRWLSSQWKREWCPKLYTGGPPATAPRGKLVTGAKFDPPESHRVGMFELL